MKDLLTHAARVENPAPVAPKPCAYVVDYDEEQEAELTCGKPADFECCGAYYCHQCAHDWLDEIEPGYVQEVSALSR